MLNKIFKLLLGLLLVDLTLSLIIVALPILVGIAIVSIVSESINRSFKAVINFFK